MVFSFVKDCPGFEQKMVYGLFLSAVVQKLAGFWRCTSTFWGFGEQEPLDLFRGCASAY
jgi:hypothetical protein